MCGSGFQECYIFHLRVTDLCNLVFHYRVMLA